MRAFFVVPLCVAVIWQILCLLLAIIGITVPAMNSSRESGAADQSKINRMLERILVALARILIRHNVGFPTFSEIAKKAFVDVATREHGLRSRPASKSRVSLLTGINRREVARVQALPPGEASNVLFNPVFRLVSLWIRDPRYRDGQGAPLAIPLHGAAPSLEDLRKQCCHDVPETAVLRELVSAGIANYCEDGSDRLALQATGYIPRDDVSGKLELMGVDVAVMLNTIDGNIADPQSPLFQRKVSFSDVSERGVALLNAIARKDGQKWLEELDQVLGAHRSESEGQFAGLGIYVFSEKRPTSSQMQEASERVDHGDMT